MKTRKTQVLLAIAAIGVIVSTWFTYSAITSSNEIVQDVSVLLPEQPGCLNPTLTVGSVEWSTVDMFEASQLGTEIRGVFTIRGSDEAVFETESGKVLRYRTDGVAMDCRIRG